MKTRIFSIMDTTKKKAGITVLCIALITTIGAGIVFATGSQKDEPINQATSPSMDDYSKFLTKVENDQLQYYYNDCWVRSLYDENADNAKPILYFNAVEDQDVLGKGTPVYLKASRNKETNEIEKLVEMSEDEVFQLMGNENIIQMAIISPRFSEEAGNVEELSKEAGDVKEKLAPPNEKVSVLPTKLIAVKMSDESKFRPEEWQDILRKSKAAKSPWKMKPP